MVAVLVSEEEEVELKFPKVIGALGSTATLNGEEIEAQERTFVLELGQEYAAE